MSNIELSSIDRCGHFVRLTADGLGEVVRHDEDAPKPVPAAGAGVPIGTPAATGAPDPSTGAPVPPAAGTAVSCCLLSSGMNC